CSAHYGVGSFSFEGRVNEDGTEVGDVGERRAGREQVADAVEKPRGIVVGEKGGGNEAKRLGPRQRRIVDKGTGGVIGGGPPPPCSLGIGDRGAERPPA